MKVGLKHNFALRWTWKISLYTNFRKLCIGVFCGMTRRKSACLNLNFAAGSNMEKESSGFLQSKLLENFNPNREHAHWYLCRSILVIELTEETRAKSLTAGCFWTSLPPAKALTDHKQWLWNVGKIICCYGCYSCSSFTIFI